MKIENYPVVKVLLPYIVGIVVAYFGDFPDTVCKALWWGAGGCFLLAVAMTFVKTVKGSHGNHARCFLKGFLFFFFQIQTLNDFHNCQIF